MKPLVWCTLLALSLAPTGRAQEGQKPASEVKDSEAGRSFEVPYRLTETKHVLIRAKINGKGPYNFILDTGAPALFVGTAVCKKLGVEADQQSWGTFDTFEIEGGVKLEKFRGRVEDPFQLEGMNGLGLAGAQLHGILGYTVLARYRIELDFTKDKMVWTRLKFDPPAPIGLGGKGGAPGGLDAVGGIMKVMGSLMGMNKPLPPRPRGFLGLELDDGDGQVKVRHAAEQGPAAAAGVRAGDRITHFAGKEVSSQADVLSLAAKVVVGQEVEIRVTRNGVPHTFAIKAGEGF